VVSEFSIHRRSVIVLIAEIGEKLKHKKIYKITYVRKEINLQEDGSVESYLVSEPYQGRAMVLENYRFDFMYNWVSGERPED
jgi:hypothetical protein